MTLSRREFLGALAAGPLAAGPVRLPQPYFGVHPFIEANPKAVFIRRTNVAHKMDQEAKLREGMTLAREIFVPMDRPGVPVTHRVILKPNVCSVTNRRARGGNLGYGHRSAVLRGYGDRPQGTGSEEIPFP